MKGAALGRMVFAGVPLLRRIPLAILAWGACLLPFNLLGNVLSAIYDGVGGSWAYATPSALRGVLQFGLLVANMSVSCAGMAVFAGAVLRAIADPERAEGRWIRLGGDEIRLALIWWLMFVVGIAMMFLVVFIVAAVSRNSHMASENTILIAAAALAAILLARFALAPAMAVFERRVAIGDSWRMTRGRYGLAVVCSLTFLVLYGGGEWLLSGLGDLLRRGAPEATIGAGPFVQELVRYLTLPEHLVPSLAAVVLEACAGVLGYAPMAVLYRDLAGRNPADQAAVFD
ncbi:MAG: hypothetical protein J7515_08035 [Caulobacter sp.]|nr:hypothetical protein [Caulobacter sp.]